MGIGSVDVWCVLWLEMLLRFGVLCCDRAAGLTAAVCVTTPASCFVTADALGNVGQLGHEYFSPRPDCPAQQAILIFEDAPLVYFEIMV